MVTGQILFSTEKKPTDFYVGGLALSLSNGVEIDLGWTKSKGVCIDDKGPSKYVIDFVVDNVFVKNQEVIGDISFATISSEGVVTKVIRESWIESHRDEMTDEYVPSEVLEIRLFNMNGTTVDAAEIPIDPIVNKEENR